MAKALASSAGTFVSSLALSAAGWGGGRGVEAYFRVSAFQDTGFGVQGLGFRLGWGWGGVRISCSVRNFRERRKSLTDPC